MRITITDDHGTVLEHLYVVDEVPTDARLAELIMRESSESIAKSVLEIISPDVARAVRNIVKRRDVQEQP